MPPRWRNQRDPTGPDTPTATAASSLLSPSAILAQNARSTSRRGGGRPGDRIGARPVFVDIHAAVRPIVTPLLIGVLRRPLESALRTPVRVMNQSADLVAVAGSLPQPLLEGVGGQVGAQRGRVAPADDPPRVDVHDEGDVHPARPGRDVGGGSGRGAVPGFRPGPFPRAALRVKSTAGEVSVEGVLFRRSLPEPAV